MEFSIWLMGVEIKPLGIIVLFLGILFFLVNRKYLFWSFIISIPFGQAVVCYISYITFYLSPALFFMLLLLTGKLFDLFAAGQTRFKITREGFLLGLFLLAGGLSLFMPLLINGQVLVHPVDSPYLPIVYEPLYFSRVNITQYLYLIFWAMAFFVLVDELKKSFVRLQKVIRILTVLGVITVMSGFANQLFRYLGLDNWAYNMYAVLGGRDLSFIGKDIGGIPLMYTIAGEPGWTSIYLLVLLGLVAVPVCFKNQAYLQQNNKTGALSLIIIFCGLIMAGTTGYAGLILFAVSMMFLGMFKLPFSVFSSLLLKTAIVATVCLCILFMTFSLTNISLGEFIYLSHATKIMGESGSGLTRWTYAMDALKIFLQYPLLGVGIGSNKSSSLLPGLLSNAGLIGTALFLAFNAFLIKHTLSLFRNDRLPVEIRVTGLSLSISQILLLGTSFFAKSIGILIYPLYWLLCAMMSAITIFAGESNLYEHCRQHTDHNTAARGCKNLPSQPD